MQYVLHQIIKDHQIDGLGTKIPPSFKNNSWTLIWHGISIKINTVVESRILVKIRIKKGRNTT